MDHITIKDPSAGGSWLLILGCPWAQKHLLFDRARNVSGPSFADCASCEHQIGDYFEQRELEEGWIARTFPEFLECGYGQADQAAG